MRIICAVRVPAKHRNGLLGLAAALLAAGPLAVVTGCGEAPDDGRAVVTFPGSAVGAEAEILRRQLARFMQENPDIVVVQRETPDAADQRHQLYVQWLNAGASEPDILQLDVVWTPEFAAAGWVLPLDGFGPAVEDFFPSTIAANRWAGSLFALPWFVDVGMLYWRTDLMEEPPATLEQLARTAAAAREAGLPYGYVLQGARYEGLVTGFVEVLGAFGGEMVDPVGRVVVDSDAAVRALTWMHDAVHGEGFVPEAALTWHEEESRFAFQNGQAAFMRNWPYAYALLQSDDSRVAGRFSIAAVPAAEGGAPTAALGGAQLAINANSSHPEAAWAVIEYLTRSEQMLERAKVAGQFPTRPALYDDPDLADALGIPPEQVRPIIERAVPRPVTPVYTQLSEILQVRIHRALTRQQEPREALLDAAREMRELLRRVGLEPGGRGGP
jgi:multiple sugar transport system substrate-binding protein